MSARHRAALGRPGRAAVRPVLAVAATAIALAITAESPGVQHADAAPAPAAVALRDIAFQPATVRVRTGRSVRWTWDDPFVAHNVRSIGRPRFKGAPSRKTGTHTVRFTRRGTYRYQCTLHPGMTGRVVVR